MQSGCRWVYTLMDWDTGEVVAMSGGVDSSAAALLLRQQGYDCDGAMLRLYNGEKAVTCCSADDADDARVRAILARTLEEDSCQYLFSFGIVATRDKIVRIPECRELGFKERSCYPIRWQERTLGYLWLVGKVSPAEDKAAVACAGELAVPMFSMQL